MVSLGECSASSIDSTLEEADESLGLPLDMCLVDSEQVDAVSLGIEEGDEPCETINQTIEVVREKTGLAEKESEDLFSSPEAIEALQYLRRVEYPFEKFSPTLRKKIYKKKVSIVSRADKVKLFVDAGVPVAARGLRLPLKKLAPYVQEKKIALAEKAAALQYLRRVGYPHEKFSPTLRKRDPINLADKVKLFVKANTTVVMGLLKSSLETIQAYIDKNVILPAEQDSEFDDFVAERGFTVPDWVSKLTVPKKTLLKRIKHIEANGVPFTEEKWWWLNAAPDVFENTIQHNWRMQTKDKRREELYKLYSLEDVPLAANKKDPDVIWHYLRLIKFSGLEVGDISLSYINQYSLKGFRKYLIGVLEARDDLDKDQEVFLRRFKLADSFEKEFGWEDAHELFDTLDASEISSVEPTDHKCLQKRLEEKKEIEERLTRLRASYATIEERLIRLRASYATIDRHLEARVVAEAILRNFRMTADYDSRHKILTREEERLMFVAYAETKDPKIREAILLSNLRLVYSIAKKHTGRGVDEEDLVEEGTIGLMKAFELFEIERGNRFYTPATWWIRNAILSAIADHGKPVRVPTGMYYKVIRYNRIYRELSATNSVTYRNLAVEMGYNPDDPKTKDLLDDLGKHSKQKFISTNKPIGDDWKRSLGDTLAYEQNPFKKEMDMEFLKEKTYSILKATSLGDLPYFDRDLSMFFDKYALNDEMEDMTLERIGQNHGGLSRERVRQIIERILKSIRINEELYDIYLYYLTKFEFFM